MYAIFYFFWFSDKNIRIMLRVFRLINFIKDTHLFLYWNHYSCGTSGSQRNQTQQLTTPSLVKTLACLPCLLYLHNWDPNSVIKFGIEYNNDFLLCLKWCPLFFLSELSAQLACLIWSCIKTALYIWRVVKWKIFIKEEKGTSH